MRWLAILRQGNTSRRVSCIAFAVFVATFFAPLRCPAQALQKGVSVEEAVTRNAVDMPNADKPAQISLTYALHIGAIVIMGALMLADLVPWTALIAMVVLLMRAMLTLTKESIKPKIVGFRELGLGLVTVALIAVGYLLNF